VVIASTARLTRLHDGGPYMRAMPESLSPSD
jgi:hypothetical protein